MESTLCFVLLIASAVSSPLPNKLNKRESASCPASSGQTGFCVFVPGYNCAFDVECSWGKVCCSDGCGKVCKSPVAAVKRNDINAVSSPLLHKLNKRESASCPASSGMAGICIFIKGYNCISDSECTGGKVCCSEGCGKVCKSPVAAVKRNVIEADKRESASCPASSGMAGICIFIKGYNCISDSECTGGKVCCSEGCGKVCKSPVAVVKRNVIKADKRETASCPASSGSIGICIFIKGYNCISDSECTGGKVCCSEGCGKVCKSPVAAVRRVVMPKVKRESASCPASSGLGGACVFIPGYNCVFDSECTGGKVCCNEGCGSVCKNPVTKGKREVTHAGACPKHVGISVGFCVFRPGINCLSDVECASNEKCCHEGCGSVCKTAV